MFLMPVYNWFVAGFQNFALCYILFASFNECPCVCFL